MGLYTTLHTELAAGVQPMLPTFRTAYPRFSELHVVLG